MRNAYIALVEKPEGKREILGNSGLDEKID
jgi:hypothetical protein